MPQLQDLKTRPTQKIVLPSSKPEDEAWVEVYTEPLADDIIYLSQFQGEKENSAVASIYRVIKDWNFTEKDGTKSPLTMDNVRRLSINDLVAIIEETQLDKKLERLSRLTDSKKKNSPSTLVQKPTPKPAKT